MGAGSRGDRQRISLLPPVGSSVTSIPSPSAAAAASDYQQHTTATRNPPRVGLMPVQPDQYCSRTPVDMSSLQQDAPPFKKIRLGPHQQIQQLQSQPQPRCLSPADPCGGKQEQQQHVVQLQQPLRIDTREQPAVGAYTPQTEAISPTLPEPSTQEDAQYRSTKDDLLQQIGKVDREIAKRENQLNMLRKRLKELEETANKPLEVKDTEEQSQQPKHQSMAQKVYAENRRKAEEAHRLLERLGPKVELPLYNQPSDTSVYQENRTRHQTCMRARLIARLRREHAERASLHRQQSQTYAILVQEWHRKVERLEATQKRKSKETKNREFFEKVFPELRKQREDKERFNRVGARIKSEADLEEIMDGLQEQEMEDKKMRSYAVIPPLLLDAKQRRIAFQNRNGLLQPEELEALHSERKLINVWSSVEHELFKEKYLQHPKNYGVIAQSLEHKSVPDCVHHYYLTKKAENYKQLLRKSRQRTRSSRNNPNNKVNNTSSTIGPIDILTTGVTTRLQREQQQKTQENPQNSSATTTSASTTSTTGTSSVSSTTVGTTTITTTTTPSSSIASGVSVTADSVTTSTTTTMTSVPNSTATSSISTTSTMSSTKDSREASKENKENKIDLKESHLIKVEPKEESQSEPTSGKDIKVIMEGKGALSSSASSLNNATNVSTIQSDFKESSKKKPGCRDTNNSGANVAASGRIKDKKKENHTPMETSDEEAPSIDVIEGGKQIGPHACTVCQSVVEGSAHSRALPRSQASQYGLREDQVPPGARVCNTCRCKAVRGRYTACPLPGCPNLSSSKSRVKRLRALPSKWLDLPPEIREPIAQEFQIPNSATKCCSACFSRISRRLAPHLAGGTEVSEDGADALSRQWTDEELEQLRRALREHGTNWPKVAEQIPGKTNHQCKNYYFAYRKKLSLDQVVAEYYASLGEERRPCLTDEEESGSSTSSCDELAVHDSSDTASAGSPATTMTGSNVASSGTAATSSSLSMSFRSSEQKLGEKLSDIAVVSLVPPGSSQQSSSSGTATATSGGREDYDSSATTADEGQGGADLENSSVVVTLTTSNSNTTSLPQHPQPPPIVHSPPSTTSNSNPLTVKDLMLGVIEMQLKRTPNSPADGGGSSAPNSSGTPTISSILKTDHRNDITYIRGYKSSSNIANTTLSNRDTNLATLSVVSGPHHAHRSAPSPQPIGQMQATITPCPPTVPSSQASSSDLLPKEGLVVMQVQQALRETEGTLDLSIKKPRLQQDYNHSMQLHKPPTVTLYRPEPPPGAYYHPHAPHPEQGRGAKSPLIYASSPRPQAPITPKMNKVTVPPPHPKLSPKLSTIATPGHKGGSITHGTPVSTARYEGLLRQMTPPGNPTVTGAAPNASERGGGGGGAINAGSAVPGTPKDTGGSITQGTPVLPFAVDKRGTPIYDYHRTIRHSPVTGGGNVPPPPPGQGPTSQAASPAVVVSHGGSQYNSYSAAGRPPPSYSMEQQLSSRQIIMNDYITSQQMHARARGSSSTGASVAAETTGKSEPPPPPSSTLYYTSTPPPSQTHTQPRQGVIQRHNPQKQMHYPPPPPGLEAFSSLVDVAVQQPSLPVPHPHGHPAASGSGGHEGLGKTMADRLLADRYDNNRAFREQEIRLQEHRMAAMQAAEHRLAVAAAVQQHHHRDRDRERDLVHLREKEEHRLHREKELQQLEHRFAVQQHHQQREKDLQQQEHRLAQQREKDMHVEHARLSVQQVREKDIQHEHRLSVHQQREKEIHQKMVAAAAQREIEHEHRLAVQQQREKEMQQQERLAIQQHEKDVERRLAMQHRERDLAHLHQQQQQQQQQIQQHIQQQRIEAERRHIAQLYRDQQQIDRDSSRLASLGFSSQPSRLQQSQQSQQQQQQSSSSSSSSRQSQSSSQQNDSSTLTAASLIDAIITHQINQSVENPGASGSSANQPARAGDRLFQGFHRENQQEPNGIAHSPAGEGSGGGNGGSGNGSGGNKAITLGEHVDHIVSKDYGPPHSSYRSYAGYQISEDQWKRRKLNEPDSVKTGDERQIIRVAQQQHTQQQQQHQSSGKQQYHTVEPVSPPEATTNHYARRLYDSSTATSTSGTPSNKSHSTPYDVSPFDYVKNKIVEVMRTEDDKAGGGGGDGGAGSDRNGGGNSVVVSEKDEKGASAERSVERSPSSGGGGGSGGGGNSGSNEMVVDNAGGPNPTTREQPPPPPAPAATTTFYPFSALGVHTGPPPAPPPTSATSASVAKSEQMQAEPAPLLSSQYEPLSDED
ncbi:nuclear receptor corepressor 1 isoform X1 [Mycetomoellerius zeteki]|uniref:nuclear receptor corepressor 1 isoform X1 n=1 Tax=Mycetomoellerius zeteki TaxID=64791 RepID=UPI00084E3832|nr:PREDICTED: nuclear receptor corepressor 1 isoform X1 [Trachymyrmex zeteki]